jgi:glycosyltransferase involved in cell wall biosynthesis
VRIAIVDGGLRERTEGGYARIAAALAAHLPRLGHEVCFEPRGDADVWLYPCPPSFIAPGEPAGGAPLRVAFTMHETEDLPEGKEDWPRILNRMDLVLTPTAWNERIWRDLGVTVPIEVVPLGIEPSRYLPSTGDRCVLLTVHAGLGFALCRENWEDTLTAYYAEFGAGERVLLRTKTWNWRPDRYEPYRARAAERSGRAAADLAPVEVLDAMLDHVQMRELYLGASLFIKDANREGWSLPCTEAAACGIPIAATRIEPLLSHLPERTRWFDPGDIAALRGLMREASDGFEAARAERERYTEATMSERVSAVLSGRLTQSAATA